MNALTKDRRGGGLAGAQWTTNAGRTGLPGQTSSKDAHQRFWARNVLVLANAGELSGAAFECARWFVGQSDGKVTVLFVTRSNNSSLNPDELREEVIEAVGVRPDQIRAILVRRGEATYPQIRDTARGESADLIIVPADFQWPPTHFWSGDPLENLIRHVPCPILIVGNTGRRGISEGEVRLP